MDLADQLDATVKYHDFWPVMKLRSPGSKSHDRAVVVRAGANWRSLIHTRAADRIGTEHVMAWNIEQVDLASEPAVQVIGSKRADGRAVMRNSRGATEPETRPGQMDYLDIGSAIECIHVEIEAAHCEHAAVTGDRIKDVPGARACYGENDVAAAGLHESGAIVLCHEGQRAVIGQSHPVHPKWIRPHERDCASVSVEDVKRRILSYRIANNSGSRRAVTRRGDFPGTGWEIWITDWIWERPVRCAVAGGPETMLPEVVARCIRLHKAA